MALFALLALVALMATLVARSAQARRMPVRVPARVAQRRVLRRR